jgi:hypothetical protein
MIYPNHQGCLSNQSKACANEMAQGLAYPKTEPPELTIASFDECKLGQDWMYTLLMY